MRILKHKFVRTAAALSLGLAVVLTGIPSASAATVFFDYSGLDSDTSAFGSFSLDDSLFDGTSFQSISQSNLLSFSFSITNLLTSTTGTWDFSGLITTTTIFFDSTGTPDVVGAGGLAAFASGTLTFARTGSVTSQAVFGSISSANGDWQIRSPNVVPLPATYPYSSVP